MAVQARAQASRQAILSAAAEVLEEVGFSGASVADVIERAGVSKGRFVYHFPNKEALASALITVADMAIADTVEQSLTTAPSALEGLVRASFAVADMAVTDQVMRVGVQLRHGLGNGSLGSPEGLSVRVTVAAKAVVAAMAEGDLRPDLDPDQIGYALAVTLGGNLLHSLAAGTDPRTGLSALWPLLLGGMVTDQSARFVQQVVTRLARHHGSTPGDALPSGI